jgi:hypothetical protein
MSDAEVDKWLAGEASEAAAGGTGKGEAGHQEGAFGLKGETDAEIKQHEAALAAASLFADHPAFVAYWPILGPRVPGVTLKSGTNH